MKYTAVAALTLPAGSVLGLTEAQAAARKHALQPASKKGTYTCTEPVQFKAGEEFDFTGDLTKAQATGVITAAEKAKAARAAAEAAAAEKEDREAQAEEQAKLVFAAARLGADTFAKWSEAGNDGLRKQYGDKFDAYLADVLKAG